MILVTIYFSDGGRETFPIRPPERGDFGEALLRYAEKKFPGRTVAKILATRSETILWPK